MTVKELIEQLQTCDPNKIVLVWDMGEGGLVDVAEAFEWQGRVVIEGVTKEGGGNA